MWSSVSIALLCILIPAYTQGSLFLQPPECGRTNVTLRRIVGGQPAKLGDWPWMTALGYPSWYPKKPQWLCGGVLISEYHVLSAAHCMTPSRPYCVRIGDLDLEDDNDGAKPFQDDIKDIVMHPNYNSRTFENDIAIVRIKRKVLFTSLICPICLPYDDKNRERPMEDRQSIVCGHGSMSSGGLTSSKLLQTQLPIITEQKCKQVYEPPYKIDGRVVCAGLPQGGKDSCQGDSGGPLMMPGVGTQKIYYSVGIVSFGYGCAEAGIPGVYTRTAYFIDFIKRAMMATQ